MRVTLRSASSPLLQLCLAAPRNFAVQERARLQQAPAAALPRAALLGELCQGELPVLMCLGACYRLDVTRGCAVTRDLGTANQEL